MKRLILKTTLLILSLALTTVMVGCGADQSLQATINGKKVSLPVDGIEALSGGLGSQQAPQGSGTNFAGQSLSLLIRFINGNITDVIQFDITNFGAVPLGQTVYVDQANVVATMTLNGSQAYISPGSGSIVFEEAGLSDGQKIRFRFDLNTAGAFITGNLETTVHSGF